MALVPEHDIWRYLCTDYRARGAAAWVAWNFGLRIKLWKLTEYRRIVYLVPCRSPVQTWSCTWQFHTISYNFCVTAWFPLPREQLNAKTESDCVCVIYCDLLWSIVIFIHALHVFRMQTLWSIVRLTNFLRSPSLIQTSCDTDNSKQGIGIHEPPSHLPLTQWQKYKYSVNWIKLTPLESNWHEPTSVADPNPPVPGYPEALEPISRISRIFTTALNCFSWNSFQHFAKLSFRYFWEHLLPLLQNEDEISLAAPAHLSRDGKGLEWKASNGLSNPFNGFCLSTVFSPCVWDEVGARRFSSILQQYIRFPNKTIRNAFDMFEASSNTDCPKAVPRDDPCHRQECDAADAMKTVHITMYHCSSWHVLCTLAFSYTFKTRSGFNPSLTPPKDPFRSLRRCGKVQRSLSVSWAFILTGRQASEAFKMCQTWSSS